MNLFKVRPVQAAQSLYSLFRNPDDTEQVFRLLEAMSAGPSSSLLKRFEKSRGGARLLDERPDILRVLTDHHALRAMPDGSLGRAYLNFMLRDGLNAEWLVKQSEAAKASHKEVESEKLVFLGSRLRDTHDLWHVVTGYGGDLLGEACVLGFTYTQTLNPGIGMIVTLAFLRADEADARRLITDAIARGIRSAWLPAVPWEDLLPLPLDVVRAQLRVGPAPTYEPFYSRDLPPGGLWEALPKPA